MSPRDTYKVKNGQLICTSGFAFHHEPKIHSEVQKQHIQLTNKMQFK